MRAVESVEFEVRYRLVEYRQFVLAYVEEKRRARPGFVGRAFLAAIAAVAFFVKSRKMPSCAFHIDHAGIRRRTRRGELVVPWSAVTAVHRYEPGYLVEKGGSALPLPYRCLDASQRAILEALFAAHLPSSS